MSIQDCVDAARACAYAAAPDTRPYEVIVQKVTWSGGAQGRGEQVVVETTITPRPIVLYPSPYHELRAGGKVEDGERTIREISTTYSLTDLTGDPDAQTEEVFSILNGDKYRLVNEPERRPYEWRVRVRKVSRGNPNR